MGKAKALRGLVARLGNAQGWLCFHCGGRMLKEPAMKAGDMGYTKDHVVPRKLNGHGKGNLVLAHRHCNMERGHQAPGPHMMQRAREIWIAARELKRRHISGSSPK